MSSLRFVVLLALLAPVCARAATLNVPSASYPTLQAGITAAANGDTVLVADGTYTGSGNVDLDFGGKAITVTSVNGSGSTTIDCQGSSSAPHRAFLFHSGEPASATVSGLTLENGYAPSDASSGDGGLVAVTNGSPTFVNCVFSGSAASAYGGAIYIGSGSGATLSQCVLMGNTAQYGGAVDAEASSALSVASCSFAGNTASASAGAVHCSAATFTDCVFSGNTASGGTGGGVYVSSANVTFSRCTVSGNAASSASGGGGGVYAYNSALTLDTCALFGNSASYGGGLALYSGSNSAVINCVFVGNTASSGGGVSLSSASPSFVNCTLTANSASSSGGAFFVYASPTLTNCILYGDSASASGSEVFVNGGSLTATYCDIQGSASGTGNINADPLFVRAPNTSAGDFGDLHLQSGSPCIGAGTSSSAPPVDFDGHARPNPPSIGAYDVSASAPSPVLSSISPNTILAGAPSFTLTVNGTGFVTGSSVQWNGTALVTTYVSATKLKAAVPKSLIASAGTASVTVTNPAPGGVSNAKVLTINLTALKVLMGTLTRDPSSGNVTVPMTVQNTGNQTAPALQVTDSQLGGYQTLTPLPLALGSLRGGASVRFSLVYPGQAGPAGSARLCNVKGAYNGGILNSTQTVTLP